MVHKENESRVEFDGGMVMVMAMVNVELITIFSLYFI